MSWNGSKPRIACVASNTAAARTAQADLATRYDLGRVSKVGVSREKLRAWDEET